MIMEVFLKSVGDLQSDEKRDGSGKWYARDLILEANDNTLYRDTFVVRYTGEKAIEPALEVGKLYQVEISFSTRSYAERTFQDMWLRNLVAVDAPKGVDEPF